MLLHVDQVKGCKPNTKSFSLILFPNDIFTHSDSSSTRSYSGDILIFRMSKDWIMASNNTWGKARSLEGENQTDYGVMSGSMRKNYVVKYCGKHHREDSMELGVRPMVGEANLRSLERLFSWMNDDKINKIGVVGMGGCGKTTLAVHVYNRLLQSEVSRVLVWVTVGMEFDVQKLQQCISNAVGLDFECDKDETTRAARLHSFLSKRKYVLILDDLWDHFSTTKVGIPISGACKVIITTRKLSVCRRTGCQETLKIGMLQDFEAWQLFCRVLGYDPSLLAADDMEHVAQLIREECAGLPLAIVLLARSLKGVNNVSEWKQTLHRFNEISKENDFLITKHLFMKLHSSYTRLTNEKFKLALLYCALYPKNCKIQRDELIRLWVAVGLIDEVRSLQAQYDKGHTIVNNLVDCSLLESSEDGHFVKLHNMIRNMVIRVTRQKSEPKFLIRCEAQLIDLAEELECKEDFIAVSLVKSCITAIPLGTSPKCPKLSVLLMQHNPLKNVPASFFMHMSSLDVLDLSNSSIQRLPDSVCDLKNIRSLLLHHCQNLTYVPSLANFNVLRILDLGYSAIGRIPCGIEMLIMLRELDLSGLDKLRVSHGLFATLPALKRLSCNAPGSLQEELQNSRSLEILDAKFQSLSDYISYVKSEHWRMLDSYHLQVEYVVDQEQQPHKVLSNYSNVVSFYGCSFSSKREPLLVPDNLNELYIEKCEGFGSLFDMFNCGEKHVSKGSLSSKNVLHINPQGSNGQHEDSYWDNTSLPSTQGFLDGDVNGGGLLPNLEICSISRCNDIKNIFTPMLIMGLQNLEILEVLDCLELRELVTKEDDDGSLSECDLEMIRLPNLRKLELTQLPVLSNIYKGQFLCTSLQSILVDDCPKLTQLPFSFFLDDQQKLPLPMLEKIEGQDKWWNSLEVNQTDAKLLLQTLFRPKICSYTASDSRSDQNRMAGFAGLEGVQKFRTSGHGD